MAIWTAVRFWFEELLTTAAMLAAIMPFAIATAACCGVIRDLLACRFNGCGDELGEEALLPGLALLSNADAPVATDSLWDEAAAAAALAAATAAA